MSNSFLKKDPIRFQFLGIALFLFFTNMFSGNMPWQKTTDTHTTQNQFGYSFANIEVNEGEEKYIQDKQRTSEEQVHVFAVMTYREAMNSGGHNLFFSDSVGMIWEDTLLAFRRLNMPEHEEILQEAIKRFDTYPSKEKTQRTEQLQKIKGDFADLDKKFAELENTKPILPIIEKYVAKNVEKF